MTGSSRKPHGGASDMLTLAPKPDRAVRLHEEELRRGGSRLRDTGSERIMSDWQKKLQALLDHIHDRHPDFPMSFVLELASVGEGKVALEILCDNLDEEGVVLAPDSRAMLIAGCREFSVGDLYWRDFVEDPQSEPR